MASAFGTDIYSQSFAVYDLFYRISKKIIDLHGGRIGVSSNGPGQGCVFEIALSTLDNSPFLVPGRRRSNTRVSPEVNILAPQIEMRVAVNTSRELGASRMGGMHILIVDDSKLNRKFMTRLLATSKVDFDVKEAEDGVAAIETIKKMSPRIQESPIDVILMDVSFNKRFKCLLI